VSAPEGSRQCVRAGCGFPNTVWATHCYACGYPLGPPPPPPPPPPPTPPAHSGGYLKTVRGTITAGPHRTDVTVLRASVPIVVGVFVLLIVPGLIPVLLAVLFKTVVPLLLTLLLPVLIVSLLVHMSRGRSRSFGFGDLLGVGILTRRARRRATNRGALRENAQAEVFRVTDHAAAVWSVNFLPRTPGQLLMGDPVELLARSRPTGELDALWVKNNRTGVTTQSSRILNRALAAAAGVLTPHI
jgi:hypothetical protein